MEKSTPRKRLSSEVESEDLPQFDDPQDLVNAIISTLQQPQEITNVAETFANDKNLATEVQAYAKIAGYDWTFYVKSLNIQIGRNTENGSNIDIDLGPAKVVSRLHAQIIYNLDLRCWQLKVLGRNGAKIDGNKVPVGPNHATALHSGAILDVGGTQMMFILPDSPPDIHPNMLHKCLTKFKQNLNKKPYNNVKNIHNNNNNHIMNNNGNYNSSLQQNSIKSFQMFDKSALTQATSAVSATSLQNNLDQDLLKEESKDIKPPYSYATMITQAILSNEDGVMSLSEIYNWISSHYAYYKYSKTGWQNSIRHNLSLNKAFEKVPRRPNEPGKGMKWQISEAYKEDFLNKISNGAINKTRRGSSVSRQLHLHLAKHKQLPETQKYYNKESQGLQHTHQGHERSNSIPKSSQSYIPSNPIQPNPLNFIPQANNGFGQRNFYQPMMYQSPYQIQQPNQGQMQPQQNPQIQQNQQQMLQHVQQQAQQQAQQQVQQQVNQQGEQQRQQKEQQQEQQQGQQQRQPQQLQKQEDEPQSKSQSQTISTSNAKSDLSSPIRQFEDSNATTPKIPKGANTNLFNLPPPHANGNTPYQGENNFTSFNSSSNSSTNHSLAQNQTTQNTELGLSFTSPKKIVPLEAFTPERGSKTAANGKLLANGANTNQSSPAFWNFVQFSTPNGQTPNRKNSDALISQGSPTLSRKVLANSNSFNTKEDMDKTDSTPTKLKLDTAVDSTKKEDTINS